MSAALVLPWVWGFAEPERAEPAVVAEPPRAVNPGIAFYRKYTEALLRRYVRMSMEAGRVPSLLGKEMFRGNVTSYRVESFEDVVIFLHDVEHCLEKLDAGQRGLVSRIALQEFTVEETSKLLRLNQRTVIRRYGEALDCLTIIFLAVKMLEPLKSCQGGESVDYAPSE